MDAGIRAITHNSPNIKHFPAYLNFFNSKLDFLKALMHNLDVTGGRHGHIQGNLPRLR